MHYKTITVRLTPDDIAYCEALALAQQTEADGREAKQVNGKNDSWAKDLFDTTNGKLAECAAHKIIGGVWYEKGREAEIDGWIDSKAIRRRSDQLIVPTVINKHAYVAVYVGDNPVFEMFGWCMGSMFPYQNLRAEKMPRPCAGCYLDNPLLEGPEVLVELARRRRRGSLPRLWKG